MSSRGDEPSALPTARRWRLDDRTSKLAATPSTPPPRRPNSGRRAVVGMVATVLILWGGLELSFRSWKARYDALAEFGANRVAPVVDPLASTLPPDVPPREWRSAVEDTHAMLLALTGAGGPGRGADGRAPQGDRRPGCLGPPRDRPGGPRRTLGRPRTAGRPADRPRPPKTPAQLPARRPASPTPSAQDSPPPGRGCEQPQLTRMMTTRHIMSRFRAHRPISRGPKWRTAPRLQTNPFAKARRSIPGPPSLGDPNPLPNHDAFLPVRPQHHPRRPDRGLAPRDPRRLSPEVAQVPPRQGGRRVGLPDGRPSLRDPLHRKGRRPGLRRSAVQRPSPRRPGATACPALPRHLDQRLRSVCGRDRRRGFHVDGGSESRDRLDGLPQGLGERPPGRTRGRSRPTSPGSSPPSF